MISRWGSVILTCWFVCLILLGCGTNDTNDPFGLFSESTVFSPGSYKFHRPQTDSDTSLITVRGDDIILDFTGVVMDARAESRPDSFSGIAIRILDSKNVTIKGLTAHGFKIAVYAENVDSLKLVDCNLSYNYRPRLNSRWEREALSDWLYYHDNDNDEWLRYGGAAYLKNCDNAVVKGLEITQGFNGLMLVNCNNGLFYNNDIRFNSGLGIGMYRSSYNRVMHNRLDWNVRGYSHGKYDRGQDSAGILLYEQCSQNKIAFNSATHCGDGLFLWAGNETMDSGTGGCNDNIIYRNDFSHSVANGVEATFSSNIIVENVLNDCRYGIWGGYSYSSEIFGNEIKDCDFGIAIEHGNNIEISNNLITNTSSGIKLWERETQPAGWGFAEKRNVGSRAYTISNNTFVNVSRALDIQRTDSVSYSDNSEHDDMSDMDKTSSSSPILIEPLEDGMDTQLESQYPRGRKYMLVNEWGPYNFAYPEIYLRRIDEEGESVRYTTSLFGPTGNWKLLGARGLQSVNPKSGATPGTLTATTIADSSTIAIDLEYIGSKFVNQFGDTLEKGNRFPITFRRFEPRITWSLDFYNYSDDLSPDGISEMITNTRSSSPAHRTTTTNIGFTWWRSPAQGVQDDKFVVIANAQFEFEPGMYSIQIESDDGVRLLIDGEPAIENWDIHTPEVNAIVIPLSGTHLFELQYFEAGGLGVLDLTMNKEDIPANDKG